MKGKTSALRPVLNQIYVSDSKESALSILNSYLDTEECVIRQDEKRVMKFKAGMCPTLLSVQQYITNSFLRYELGSVNLPPHRWS